MSHQHMIAEVGAAPLPRGQRLYHANEVVCVARGPRLDDRKGLWQVRRGGRSCMARCDTLDFTKICQKRSPRQPGMARPAHRLLLWAA